MTIRELYETATGSPLDEKYFKSRNLNPDDKVKAEFAKAGKPGMLLHIWDMQVEYKALQKAYSSHMEDKHNFVQFGGGSGEEIKVDFSFHPNAVPNFIRTTGMTQALGYVKEDDDHFYFKVPLLFDSHDGAFVIMNQKGRLGLVRISFLRSLNFDEDVLPMVVWNVLRLMEKGKV